jgi:hypothetical protein
MSDDLVKRLRVVTGFIRFETGDRVAASVCLSEEAADRIEALTAKVKLMDDLDVINGEKIEGLTAERDMATEGWAEATRLIDVARQQYGAEKSRAEAAEAKLAKAVRGLNAICVWGEDTYARDMARTTLAEIENSEAVTLGEKG